MPTYIAGMAMRLARPDGSLSAISGPLPYSLLGCAYLGGAPIALGTISDDVTSQELRAFDRWQINLTLLRRQSAPSLVLQRSTAAGRWQIEGTPVAWSPRMAPASEEDVLYAAAIDPAWIVEVGMVQKRRLLAMDLQYEWMRARPRETARAVELCDFVSGTDFEFEQLPAACMRALYDKETILLLKHGPRGATLNFGQASIDLPPPSVRSVRTDVGAGDLLFGALASATASSDNKEDLLFELKDSYMASLPLIAALLESDGPEELYERFDQMKDGQACPCSIYPTHSSKLFEGRTG